MLKPFLENTITVFNCKLLGNRKNYNRLVPLQIWFILHVLL